MRKQVKVSIYVLLLFCYALTSFTACSKNNGRAGDTAQKGTQEKKGKTKADVNKEDTKGNPDTSDRVDLVFYLMGDPPNDMPLVQDRINELLLQKINTTVTFKYTSWTDWQTKYNMILSSGEECDLIYTANWMNYAELANSNAFTPLDELLPVYAPDIYNDITQDVWKQMKVKGKIYSVPSSKKEYTNAGIMYREDLREKYNLPVPDSFSNLEAYLMGVKKNNPTQSIMKPSVNTASFSYSFSATMAFQAKYAWVQSGAPYGLAAEYNTPSKLFDYWASDDFRDDMMTMKKWADAGFWSRSVLSDANNSDAFINGQDICIIDGQNPAKFVGTYYNSRLAKDWKVGYVPYASINGIAYANHPSGNGTAIPTNSKYPKRAAMALNLLYMDKDINRLLQYGIKGTHYTLDAEGYYKDGQKHKDFSAESANAWGLRNPLFTLPSRGDDKLNKIFSQLHRIALKTKYPDVDIASGFVEVYDDYASERAALANVMIEYLAPLQAGLVDDVDGAVDEFLQKAAEAGLTKIQEAYTKQWEAYCENYGYK